MLDAESRKSLGMMAVAYHEALLANPLALSYLSGRGISQTVIDSYRLGQVDGAYPEHAIYEGRISIPYVTKLGGVVALKFRVAHDCTEACEHQKYITPYSTRIYNPLAFERAEQVGYIGVCEGEFDAMILTAECDIPSVAVPGVDTWKQHQEWPRLFDGFPKVYIFKDNDEAGEKLANRISGDLESTVTVGLPLKDVNATFCEYGARIIREAAGLE
jgi:DNA primase